MKAILVLLFLVPSSLFATELNVELGGVQNPYNRAEIGKNGTAFDLADSFEGTQFYHRLSLSHKFNRHGVRLLYAPLKFSGSETYSKDITFSGVTFAGGNETDTEYQFNSYRASWFYQVDEEGPWQTRLGVTAKVRDAKIKLSQGNTSKFKKNTGIVPLFYVFSTYEWSNGLRLAFDFDGWAAPQGRAFDGALMAGYAILPKLDLNVGYRMLEGGSDNDDTYTFARFEYFFTSINWEF